MASLETPVRGVAVLIVVSLALTGCAEPDAARPKTYMLEEPVDHLDTYASEPMLLEHPDGNLFVSGWGAPGPSDPKPLLWRSADGAAWQRVDVGTTASDAYGGTDVDLAVGSGGTIYFTVMDFNMDNRQGDSVAVGVSHDVGSTWSWTYISRKGGEDRPWVEVTLEFPGFSGHPVCLACEPPRTARG